MLDPKTLWRIKAYVNVVPVLPPVSVAANLFGIAQ